LRAWWFDSGPVTCLVASSAVYCHVRRGGAPARGEARLVAAPPNLDPRVRGVPLCSRSSVAPGSEMLGVGEVGCADAPTARGHRRHTERRETAAARQ
jgi:hypothetical protein